MKEIIVHSRKYGNQTALVDDENYEYLNKYYWWIMKANNTFYAKATIDNKLVSMHRAVTGFKQVDHINNNGLDNQHNNLRECTTRQNAMNRKSHKNTTSDFKGVSWHKYAKKWEVRIKANNQNIWLGYFNNEIEAAKIYNRAAIKYFGEFAYLNTFGGQI